MVVRASRKQDADVAGELTWWLPVPIYLVGEVIHELRTRRKHQGLWLVEVAHRRAFKAPVLLGEFSKADALALADARADEITREGPQ